MNVIDTFKRSRNIFKGKKGLDINDVYFTLYGKSYYDLNDDLKAKFENAYKTNKVNLDKLYLLKKEELNLSFANPIKSKSSKTLATNGSIQRAYEYFNSGRPDNFDAASDYNNRISKMDENQLLEETLKSAPLVKLALLEKETANKPLYSGSVKHTKNDAYYNSLISKVNLKYGTNFKNREDIAAFLKAMGAKKIDGIIGPETESLLDNYYPSKNDNLFINNRRMYSDNTNNEIYNSTSSILFGNVDPINGFIEFKNRLYARELIPGYNSYPFLAARSINTDYINPYSTYLRYVMMNYKLPTIGPSPYYETYYKP